MIAAVDYRQLAADYARLHSERCADLLASESEVAYLKNMVAECHKAYLELARRKPERRSFWCWLRSLVGGEA